MGKKKKKKGHPPVNTPAQLRFRVEKARAEGRSQQALELARQLYKQEATPEHLALLKESSLGRAEHLRAQGYTRDALTVLENAVRLDGQTGAWLERLASEFARCGAADRAMALLQQVPGSQAVARVQTEAADAAVVREAAGRDTLPEGLRPDFDRILLAFRQVEQGKDTEARETLQGVGLRSPFMEWKLLLRGLQAYYANDDERALENWTRLDPTRPPARLAAPFRAGIDPEYLRAQTPATQSTLQKQLESFQASHIVVGLRNIRRALEHRTSLAEAFRLADRLLPVLRREAPHLVHRLASCFYWAITETGPEDALRYRRVFGAPIDDREFHRLRALACDRNGLIPEAHRAWQEYEKEIEAHPELWPGEEGTRARALIWLHLGHNAASVPGPKRRRRLPPYAREELPPIPDPPAERCFQRSLELAPDLAKTYEALFDHLLDEEKFDRAEKVARRMLERFPGHVGMLTKLGRLRLREGHAAEGLELLQQALKNNPLDRKLRGQVAQAHLACSESYLRRGWTAKAEGECEQALGLSGPRDVPMILCRRASCAFKGGDEAQGEELVRQARERALAPVEVSHLMLGEATRFKLARPMKTRFNKEFDEGLRGTPDGAAAAGLAHTVATQHRAGVQYHGQKTHDKKVMSYLDRLAKGGLMPPGAPHPRYARIHARMGFEQPQQPRGRPPVNLGEEQMDVICEALVSLGSKRAARQFAQAGQVRFPKNPYFPYYEAQTYLQEGEVRDNAPTYEVRQLLEDAQRLGRALPPDERQQEMLAEVERILEGLNAMDPFGRMFGGFPFGGFFGGPFGSPFGPPDDFYDDDDDDYDEDDDSYW